VVDWWQFALADQPIDSTLPSKRAPLLVPKSLAEDGNIVPWYFVETDVMFEKKPTGVNG
jgi:hypothetical protein